MSIKYYALAKGEEPPEEFCAVRHDHGEPSEYHFYVKGPEVDTDETGRVIHVGLDGRTYVPEPIRCKDCKHGKAIESFGCIKFHHADERLQPKDPEGFCAWAEPREGKQNELGD